MSKLRSTLSTYDNELTTLKARAKTAASTKKINAQLSTMDSSGTVSMLERMKDQKFWSLAGETKRPSTNFAEDL